MDNYGKRLLIAAAMLGSAALCATVSTADWARVQPVSEVQEWSAPAAAQTEQSGIAQEALPAAQVLSAAASEIPPNGFFVVLRTTPGREVSVSGEEGASAQTCVADETGTVTFSGLLPGQYRLVSGSAAGEFYLWENAAVTAVSGTLWSDGELLHLTDTPTVALTLEFYAIPEPERRAVTVTLTSMEGVVYTRSVYVGTPGPRTVLFRCLPPGAYRLRINGELLRNLTLTDKPEQFLRVGY